jgi:hypothetical protein
MATTEQIQDIIDLQNGNTPTSILRLLAQDTDTSVHSAAAFNFPKHDLNEAIKKVGIAENVEELAKQVEDYKDQRRKEREEAYNNTPILPLSGTDSYEIHSIVREYGGTNGNPVTEGIQTIVSVEVWNDDDPSCNINFYNKEELDKFILELQDARGKFQ